jgi:phage terminase large subunit-like protein
MVKIDPTQLPPMPYAKRPDPSADWTDNPAVVREALGTPKLTAGDRLRLSSGWLYSQAAAEHFEAMCRQFMVHSKGRWGGQALEWHEWQRQQWIRPLFGWYTPDKRRGIRRAYIECGKKSGKSTFAAAVATYMSLFFGEPGAEVYCLASTSDQARIVQLQIEHFVRNSPELLRYAQIHSSTQTRGGTITWPQSQSKIEAMSGRGASGFNPSCLIMDELHEWRGADAFDRWTYGSAARDSWLHLMITNAGDDLESVCYRQRSYAQQVNNGEVDDPTYYGRIYAATREQAEAEIESVAHGATRLPVACQCNPGLGTILREDDLILEIKQALHIPSNLPNLLRFWYCVWRTAAETEWLVRFWDDCLDQYTLDDLAGQPAWLGLDLSSVCDLTALVLCAVDERKTVRCWPWFFVPRSRADELRKWTAIEHWEQQGHVHVQPGRTIDQQQLREVISQLCETHDVRGLVYDAREATDLVNWVDDYVAIDTHPFKQSHENYHEPTDRFEAAVKSNTLRHPGNQVLTWQAKHAACVSTTHGYKKPLKPDQTGAPHKSVDGVQALVMAFSQAMHYDPDNEKVTFHAFA